MVSGYKEKISSAYSDSIYCGITADCTRTSDQFTHDIVVFKSALSPNNGELGGYSAESNLQSGCITAKNALDLRGTVIKPLTTWQTSSGLVLWDSIKDTYNIESKTVKLPNGTVLSDNFSDFSNLEKPLKNSIEEAGITSSNFWTGGQTGYFFIGQKICNAWGQGSISNTTGVYGNLDTTLKRWSAAGPWGCSANLDLLCLTFNN